MLLNQIKGNAYEHYLKNPKLNNFNETLPEHIAEQANENLKSIYNLDFLGITKPVLERKLENMLVEKIRDFLIELVGIILCAEKNDLIVELALRNAPRPIGVAGYQLAEELPKKLKEYLSTIEELKIELIDNEMNKKR